MEETDLPLDEEADGEVDQRDHERRSHVEEAAAERARLYRSLTETVKKQTTILVTLERDLHDRPTKTQAFRLLLIETLAVLAIVGVMFLRVISIQAANHDNGNIIKAATGCQAAQTVRECEQIVLNRSQAQAIPFLIQEDCLFRRALAHLPPPARYDTPCQLPPNP
jgi:ferric-dicitrate binding protein FerR (iron transport regulator)